MARYDAHIHLDFLRNAREVALDAQSREMRLFANTVVPQGFVRTCDLVGDLNNVDVGLGLHPWWVDDASLGEFDELFDKTNWIGEVGLDFSPKRTNHGRQTDVFTHIAQRCAKAGGKVLSIHSVRAGRVVLDILEQTRCTKSCACIFHWFSGSTEDLWRAIRAGCWFSVNENQARSRRAKEQLKLIPANKLLFETDLPSKQDSVLSVCDIEESLDRAQALTSAIRGDDAHATSVIL